MIAKRWLIVRAGGDMRIVKKRQPLDPDEVAFELNVDLGDHWAKTVGKIELKMPNEPPKIEVVQ